MGLACPDLYRYFLATKLVTTSWWLNPDITNPATLVEAAVVKSLEVLKFLLFPCPRAPYPLHTTLHAWRASLQIEPYPKHEVSPRAPV